MYMENPERTLLVNYSDNDVFDALCSGMSKCRGFKIIKADRKLKKIELEAGIRIFCWGNVFTVTLVEMPDKTTEITVKYMPGTTGLLGSIIDVEKIETNINTIFSSIASELNNYCEIVPDIGSAYANGGDSIIKLEALQQMLDRHLISQKEFDEKKRNCFPNYKL